MRRIVIMSALILGSTLWAAPAADAKPPRGGCPTPEWELRASPPADDPAFNGKTDQNGDGLSCWLEAPEGGGIFTIIDNTVRPR